MTPRELCDLYGRAGFDVLAVTDHTTPDDHLRERDFDGYLEDLAGEAERARRLYDLVVIPGLELTWDEPDPSRSGHALALGLRNFVGVADGLENALRAARAQGAALIAAHPYEPDEVSEATRSTAAFAADPSRWAPLLDRFELFNRDTLFSWVADARLPAVASGDVHVAEHLATWKTLLPCAKDARAVVDYLRSPRPSFLVALEPLQARVPQAA